MTTPWRATTVRRSVRLALIALATTIASLAGACSPGLDTGAPTRPTAPPPTAYPTPEDDPLGGFTPEPPDWEDCGVLECAAVQVPLDWDDLDGAKLELAIARRPAEGDPRGSVLVNPGGPGGSGIELLDYVFLADPFDGLRDHFDIVGWDPRGTNGSEAVDCDAPVDDFRALDPSPDDAKEADELVDAATEIAQDCERAASDRLAHISTDDTVKDMEAIRRALGDEQLSFYGFSYGTALGAFYAEQFPDRVRAIVLDGVVDPGADLETYLTAQARGFDRALDAMFEACGDACPDGGVAELYDRLADRVERSPIGSGSDTLGPAELATAAISATYSPDGGPAFADALQQADDGDPTALLSLAAQYYSTDYTPYLAIECVDQAHPMGDAEWAAFVERLEGISPRLGGSIGNELLPCANWPVAPVEPRPFPSAGGSNPILVIGNTGDAATPFSQAEAMAEGLDNAVLVTHEGTGHTSYGNPCVDEISAAYLTDLTLPDDDTICRD